MNPEQLVTSLDLSRKLRDAGMAQGESYFSWKVSEFPAGEITPRLVDNRCDGTGIYIDAPTSGEIGERLPDFEDTSVSRWKGKWEITYKPDPLKWYDFEAPTEQEARGLMWLWLKENGYLDK